MSNDPTPRVRALLARLRPVVEGRFRGADLIRLPPALEGRSRYVVVAEADLTQLLDCLAAAVELGEAPQTTDCLESCPRYIAQRNCSEWHDAKYAAEVGYRGKVCTEQHGFCQCGHIARTVALAAWTAAAGRVGS